jgi:hypothetical protein
MKELQVTDVQEVADIVAPAIVIDGLQWAEPNEEQLVGRLLRPVRPANVDPNRFLHWLPQILLP